MNDLPAKLKTPILPKVSTSTDVTEIADLFREADVKQTPPGYTPLAFAIAKGDKEKATCLVGKGARLDYENETRNYKTPLLVAIANKNSEMAQYLLDMGAGVNYRGEKSGWTPLLYSVIRENAALVELLLKKGADPSFEPDQNLSLPLCPRTKEERKMKKIKAVLSDLLKDKDQIATVCRTPLMLATLLGNKEIVRVILDSKPDISQTYNKDIISPLLLSVLTKFGKITELLLERGEDPNQESTMGLTPLGFAVTRGDIKIAKILLNFQANPAKEYTYKKKTVSPIGYATENNMIPMLNVLQRR